MQLVRSSQQRPSPNSNPSRIADPDHSVTNAGGLGVIGGVGYTPDMLREQIAELKGYLNDKNAPFGVDLLIPQVGGSARKTKYAPSLRTHDPT